MESDTTTAVLTSPGKSENPMAEGFTGFVSLAMLEFQATLQLLVERARFVTAASSVALATKEDGEFVYAAGTGDSAPEAGVAVDTAPPSIQRCLKHQLPVQTEASPAQPSASLIVPILKDGKLCGFFELLGRSRFEQSDLEAVARLAEMVNTAIEHRSAAIRVESREFGQVSEMSRAPVPKLWHAPESAEPKPEPSTSANLPRSGCSKLRVLRLPGFNWPQTVPRLRAEGRRSHTRRSSQHPRARELDQRPRVHDCQPAHIRSGNRNHSVVPVNLTFPR